MESQRAKRGTVAIEEKQGKWRLRLPRTVAKDSQRYIATRLDATPENFKKAQTKAWEIEEDISKERFDTSLSRYQFSVTPVLTVISKVTEPNLGELWQRYSDYRQSQVAITTFKQTYQVRYLNHINNLPSKKLEDAVAIRDYLIKNLSPKTARLMLTQLGACCSWAVRSGLIKTNPFSGMAVEVEVKEKSKDDIDPFSLAEREAILNEYRTTAIKKFAHYYSFVRFLFLTGCRTGEAAALRWRHITKDCSSITFSESYSSRYKLMKDTKTGITRRFPCSPVLKEFLLSLRPDDYQPDDFVFTSVEGTPVSQHFSFRYWLPLVMRLVEEGKVERYRPSYNARHTFITACLEAGVTVPQVAKLVGNSPQVILESYAGNLLKFEVPVV